MNLSLQQRIQKVLASVFISHKGDFLDEYGPEDIEGWDSIGHLDLAMAISTEFEIELEFEEVMAIEKVGDIIKTLEQKGIA